MTTPGRSVWLLQRIMTRCTLRELRTGQHAYWIGEHTPARLGCVHALRLMGHERLADVVTHSWPRPATRKELGL